MDMSEQEKQGSQKTVVAFTAGLLIGGLLVWVFTASPEEAIAPSDTNEASVQGVGDIASDDGNNAAADDTTPEMLVGDGSIDVRNQPSGTTVVLGGATFPNDEGWIGVRDFVGGQLTGLLGVVRFSKTQKLVPEEIVLQRPTVAGETYAVVFYTENGDKIFNLADDVQVEGVLVTFVAQ